MLRMSTPSFVARVSRLLCFWFIVFFACFRFFFCFFLCFDFFFCSNSFLYRFFCNFFFCSKFSWYNFLFYNYSLFSILKESTSSCMFKFLICSVIFFYLLTFQLLTQLHFLQFGLLLFASPHLLQYLQFSQHFIFSICCSNSLTLSVKAPFVFCRSRIC